MAKLIVSPQAELDITAIPSMLEDKADDSVATRYRREFDGLFERSMMFPLSGALRPRLGEQVRIGVVEPYVVIYAYRDEILRIVRVLDGLRNITKRLVRA